MNFFDYLNSINSTKENIMQSDIDKSAYSAFMVNRGLSYFPDSVAQANMMNQRWHASERMQYDFLRNTVSTRKRFSKWFKPEKSETVDLVKEYYGYSSVRAREVIPLLSESDIENIKTALYKGGNR